MAGIQLLGDSQFCLGLGIQAVPLTPLCQGSVVLDLPVFHPRLAEGVGFLQVLTDDLDGVGRDEDASCRQNDEILVVEPRDFALKDLAAQENENGCVLPYGRGGRRCLGS